MTTHGNETCRRCGYKINGVNGMYCVLLKKSVEYADDKPRYWME